ncbi:ribonuclease H-like domain-containing protein [Tanacetum coccineum]
MVIYHLSDDEVELLRFYVMITDEDEDFVKSCCKESLSSKDYILLPFLTQDSPFSFSLKDSSDAGFKPSGEEEKKDAKDLENEDSEVPSTKEPRINQEKDAIVNSTNNINTASRGNRESNLLSFQNCLFTCFLSQVEPKKVIQAVTKNPQADRKLCMNRASAVQNYNWFVPFEGFNKWLKSYEEGIDYDEVFAPVARIEAIRMFLAYASFKDFVMYQMDMNSAFLYGKIEEEVYVCQPSGFEDPKFPNKVYKVEKDLYGLHQAYRAWFQVTPKTSHLHVVKRIFRYLKGHPKLSLWYPRDSPFYLEAFTNSDYAGASLDRKSTTGDEIVIKEWEDRMERAVVNYCFIALVSRSGQLVHINSTNPLATINEYLPRELAQIYALTVNPTIYTTCIKQFWATAKVKIVNGERQIQALVDKKKWKFLIHTILQCLSAKTTAWNEFSSTMASAIIRLATN